MTIVLWAETTLVNGRAADLLVEARATKTAPVKQFAVVFSEVRPLPYITLPILWMNNGAVEWVLKCGSEGHRMLVSREDYWSMDPQRRTEMNYQAGPDGPFPIEDFTCILRR